MKYKTLEASLFRQLLDTMDLTHLYYKKPLAILGIEVTQAIQYFRSDEHLTDAADCMPDNSATLVANKPAWVRVYVRSGIDGDITDVTGQLAVARRTLGFLYLSLATLDPQPPGTVTAREDPLYTTERGNTSYTLNFIIPADEMCGTLRLTASVTAPDGKTDESEIYVDATRRQTLSVRGIMVGYDGPDRLGAGASDIVLAAPTLADLEANAAWTLLTYPVQSEATFGNAGTVTWDLPLTDAPSCNGCCSPNWVALNAAVEAQKVADGNLPDVLYYGLMANGIPMGPIIGCNSGGVSTGENGNQVTMAHELGHACGLPHAPCGVGGDPTYPAYEPYDGAGVPGASIGEYGLDISTGIVMPPSSHKDWMSYCAPRWISLHNHARLINNAGLNPEWACVDHPWILYEHPKYKVPPWEPYPVLWRRAIMQQKEPVISVIGIMHAETEVEVKTVMRLDAVRQVPKGEKTALQVELLDEKQEVIDRAPLMRLPSQGCTDCGSGPGESPGTDYPYLFQAFLSDKETGAALRIRQGERELWVRQRPRGEPKIENFNVLVEGNRLVVIHEVHGDVEAMEYWLQWSDDEGETWQGLATGVRGDKTILDASDLPAGPVLVRLLAGDGFHTTVSEPVRVEIPRRPPRLTILTPRDGQTLLAGGPMRLWGSARTGGGAPLEGAQAAWILDNRQVGEGLDVFVQAPPEGRHHLILQVSLGKKERTQVAIDFATVQFKPDK